MGKIFNTFMPFIRRWWKRSGQRCHGGAVGWRIPENIFIHQSVDQLAVLERADLFITHGGMNSLNEALCYTMPMVVVPMADDQPMIGARIAELGLGTVVSRRKING